MAAREMKIRQEDRSTATDYLKKASDWNAAATLAVQCAISSADAICVHEKGMRSISHDHFDVCDLVGGLPLDGSEEKSKQLRKIIAHKNLVQYECRSVHKDEVDDMVRITSRIYQWVRQTISI